MFKLHHTKHMFLGSMAAHVLILPDPDMPHQARHALLLFHLSTHLMAHLNSVMATWLRRHAHNKKMHHNSAIYSNYGWWKILSDEHWRSDVCNNRREWGSWVTNFTLWRQTFSFSVRHADVEKTASLKIHNLCFLWSEAVMLKIRNLSAYLSALYTINFHSSKIWYKP